MSNFLLLEFIVLRKLQSTKSAKLICLIAESFGKSAEHLGVTEGKIRGQICEIRIIPCKGDGYRDAL